MKRILMTGLLLHLVLVAGCTGLQRKYLFYPTHRENDGKLVEWMADGEIIGYCRVVPGASNVWLLMHGNAGQAIDRAYALPSFSNGDSVFILEYPGYGSRKGKPSMATFNAAATQAYLLLRADHPRARVCAVGESIGTGPACVLANLKPPPDKILLIVPFDKLTSVASEHARCVPLELLMEAKWDNIRALSAYSGPVEIVAAQDDGIIPSVHARRLAEKIPSAKLHMIPGGHNEWALPGRVEIRNP